MRQSPDNRLGKAVVESMRVFADLAARWLRAGNGDCAAVWTRREALVVVAVGYRAERIAGELERAGLITKAQRDKPEHLSPGTA